MRVFIRKELISIFCSGTGAIFAFAFLITLGLLLWFFAGSFNIPDAGYASLEKFFTLAPTLLIILIPALTMRLIAEEKKNKTLALLRSRPIGVSTIWFSKWIASFIFIVLVLLSTSAYIYTLYTVGSPVGNIDLSATLVSYLSLILLCGVFIGVGLLASAATSNQIIAFVAALILNFLLFYGFDFIAGLFQSGNMQAKVSFWGLSFHFGQMQRGVIESADIALFLFYIIFSWILSVVILSLRVSLVKKSIVIASVCMVCLGFILFVLPNYRFDFTKDKRYTISDYSKDLMSEIAKGKPAHIKINVYLEGNLNYGFQRLRNATADLLNDLNRYADYKMDVTFVDPTSAFGSRKQVSENMSERGMTGVLLNEVDRDGKVSQQLIYPYTEAIAEQDTLVISLLKNVAGNTAEENLNISAENLEFQIMDALNLLLKNEGQNIAFIEGHGELSRAYLYDAEEALAKYYFVNRGQIGNDISILDDFKVVIIAGATQKFTENEKYILDQYLMKGGRILWLMDGVYLSHDDLAANGHSASMKNETNLDDLLFNYGVRIQPALVQDSQCASILVNTGKDTQAVTVPCYYSPLLLPSPDNIVTKGMAEVKSEFTSYIDLLDNSKHLNRAVLLTTAAHSHIVPVPETIDFDIQKIQSDPAYFNTSFLSVGVSLEGSFISAFNNRLIPDSVYASGYKTINESSPTKMIVVASSSIIRNGIIGQGDETQVLPMGFDRLSGRQYGNRDFIVNAVNWLANEEAISIKTKSRQLNLLNKQLVFENRTQYAIVNTLAPLLFIYIIIVCVYIHRKRKYTR